MVSERAMEDISALTIEAGAEVPTEDEFADETRRVTLYTLSDKRKTLVPVVREITCVNEKSLAQAALDTLLDTLNLEEVASGKPATGLRCPRKSQRSTFRRGIVCWSRRCFSPSGRRSPIRSAGCPASLTSGACRRAGRGA